MGGVNVITYTIIHNTALVTCVCVCVCVTAGEESIASLA